MHSIKTIVSATLAAALVVAMTAFASLAASDFEGVWAVKGANGQAV